MSTVIRILYSDVYFLLSTVLDFYSPDLDHQRSRLTGCVFPANGIMILSDVTETLRLYAFSVMAGKCPFGVVLWAWHWKGWTDAELVFTFRFFRPPDIVVGGLIFYRDSSSSSSSSSFFFFRLLISELAERNSSKIGHMLGSNCDLKTHVQNLGVSSPPTNRGPKNHLLARLRNLTSTVMAYIFGTKHDIDSRILNYSCQKLSTPVCTTFADMSEPVSKEGGWCAPAWRRTRQPSDCTLYSPGSDWTNGVYGDWPCGT